MHIASEERVWTIAALLEWSREYLSGHGIDDARLTAELLLCRVLNCRRIDLYLKFDMLLQEEELARYKSLFRRRLGHEPLQYILGETEFMGLKLHVDRRVLIPRPETEVLVETVLSFARTLQAPRILDIGTGSGNIPVSIATSLPAARITSVDISAEALEVALENCRLHRCDGHVVLLQADVRTVPAEMLHPPFDIVVSNPPYISRTEFDLVEPEVRDFEPQIATTDGGDGLTYLSAIIDRSRSWLAPGGRLALEVGFDQAASIEELCRTSGYEPVERVRDLAGIERIVTAGWRA